MSIELCICCENELGTGICDICDIYNARLILDKFYELSAYKRA